jgi:hypothetical protein
MIMNQSNQDVAPSMDGKYMAGEMIPGMLLLFYQEPLNIHRAYIQLCDSVSAALYLTYVGYASESPEALANDGWFARTEKEWGELTGLTRDEQVNARKRLRNLGVIEEVRRGMPCRLWQRINMSRLSDQMNEMADKLYGDALETYREGGLL